MFKQKEINKVHVIDRIWEKIRQEAKYIYNNEQALAKFIFQSILMHNNFEQCIAYRMGQLLGNNNISSSIINQIFNEIILSNIKLKNIIRTDIIAFNERDPATKYYVEALLYLKGFHAIITHRIAHELFQNNRKDLAFYLQSCSSRLFSVDIHPKVKIGKGFFLDHATNVVIGETSIIEDEVSILQGVTLGGTGKDRGNRHPKVRRGVLIGAGAKILGNIEIGSCVRIGAGSVVLKSIPNNKTVVGVPAKIVGEVCCSHPALKMDHVTIK